MGMPACTITSQTAHGGVVIIGEPTVLIGEMPASRIGDMHTCPAFDGPVPHVGGPLILGSPTVLVGDMPQSRETDELTCVGPPDVVMRGCETVLVGMAGGGGAGGAMSGIAAMGVGVPTRARSSSRATAELQYDGTIRTSTTGERLPPITLRHRGWPSLPSSVTQSFQSAQPVTLPENTVLYPAQGEGNWTLDPSASSDPANPVVVPSGGAQVWMGTAASQGQQPGAVMIHVPAQPPGNGTAKNHDVSGAGVDGGHLSGRVDGGIGHSSS